jgi:ComF family protein
VLLAPCCAVCASALEAPTQGPICTSCWRTVARLTPPLCERCGDPLPSRPLATIRETYPHCWNLHSAITRSRAVGPYEGPLRQVIHLLKYDRRHTLAVTLGALMRQAGTTVLYDADCVIPVPFHARRRRIRGFNQAAELAAQLERPVADALRRIVATRPLAELPAASRYRNVAKAFAPARAIGWRPAVSQIRGARVVIVDDVVTTGATVEACAGVLRSLSAREVRVLTLARVGRSRSP